jgi:NADH-quinone oxidoreductase subunit H
LLFAVPAAWFFLWVERKAVALMQQRIGPPFMQPFFDFIKLLGKDHASPQRNERPADESVAAACRIGGGGRGWTASLCCPSSGGFQGDLILLAGAAGTPFHLHHRRRLFVALHLRRDRLGARSCLTVSYNVVFLLAIVSIAASQHTFPSRSSGAASAIAAALARRAGHPRLPARQTAYQPLLAAQRRAGNLLRPMIEYAGPELAMWELSHGLEWVAATGLVATLARRSFRSLVARRAPLRRALLRNRAAVVGSCRRHGAPGH